MNAERPEFSYVAEKPCGCVVACIVDDIIDDPDFAKEIGSAVRRWKKAGLAVKRVPNEYVREHFHAHPCPHDLVQGVLL